MLPAELREKVWILALDSGGDDLDSTTLFPIDPLTGVSTGVMIEDVAMHYSTHPDRSKQGRLVSQA